MGPFVTSHFRLKWGVVRKAALFESPRVSTMPPAIPPIDGEGAVA
jgi:hypothetical protein